MTGAAERPATMNTQTNRKIVEDAMSRMSKGDTSGFADAMHDDFVFRPMAASRHGTWGEAYEGKTNARMNFFRPWHAQLEGKLTNTPTLILADGDHVVVESKGNATMKSGEPYCQNYCMVLRMEGGKIMEMREYFDSGLADALFKKV